MELRSNSTTKSSGYMKYRIQSMTNEIDGNESSRGVCFSIFDRSTKASTDCISKLAKRLTAKYPRRPFGDDALELDTSALIFARD